MAGRPSGVMIRAINLVLAGKTPYAAAKLAQINLCTMYRSRLYRLWKAGDITELRREIDVERPRPRKIGKKAALKQNRS